MSIRTLFAIFLGFAVLLAPALTSAGEALAAVPDHHAQMMQSGHCKDVPKSGGDEQSSGDEAAGETCCMTMCMGVATNPAAPPSKVALHGPGASFALTNPYRGRIAEIATPPPKFA